MPRYAVRDARRAALNKRLRIYGKKGFLILKSYESVEDKIRSLCPCQLCIMHYLRVLPCSSVADILQLLTIRCSVLTPFLRNSEINSPWS